ncbi:MAG: beta strand repeat-containing protein, partial [Terriglobia bacterium]
MKNRKEMLWWISTRGFLLFSIVALTSITLIAKGPAKHDAAERPKAATKYGLASGADQVLTAAYDPSTQAIRVEGATGSGGGGTVSSVGLSMPSVFSVTGGPITSTGVLSVNWAQPVSVANGGTGQATAAAAFNALAPSTSAGGLIYGTGLNTYGNLTLGASGQCLASNGVTLVWTACASGTAITLAGDLSGTLTSQTVVGLQGHAVSAAVPVSGQVLEWNAAANAWTPAALPSLGTVTAVSLTAPSIFNVAGSPITTSGTLALSLVPQPANAVLAGPSSGAAAAPAFRALVGADLPAVNLSAIGAGGVTGTLSVANGGTGLASAGLSGQCLSSNGAALIWTACGAGTVTSVGLTLPTGFVSAGSPVTTAGTLGVSMPSGWGVGALLVGNGANSVAALSLGAAGQCLTSNGTTTLWGACGSSGGNSFQVNGANTSSQASINFQSGGYITVSNPSAGNVQFNFSGPLAVANGGTGLTSLGASGQCLGSTGSAMVWQSCGSSGLTLETNTTNNSSQTTLNLSNGTNITFANTSGGIVTASVSGTLAASAIPAINLGASGDGGVTGTLPVGNGGTGLTVVGSNGQCLTSTGTVMAWGSCSASGAMAIGGAVTGGTSQSVLYINASGQLAQDNANLSWNDAAKTLTVGNIVLNGSSTSQTLTLPTAAMLLGAGSSISLGSNTGNIPSISANGGTVTPIAPLNGDLGGSWTSAQVTGLHFGLTGVPLGSSGPAAGQLIGFNGSSAGWVANGGLGSAPNEASTSGAIDQQFSASGNGTTITFTVLAAGFQPYLAGDIVGTNSCGIFDAGSLTVVTATSTTFTVTNSSSGTVSSCNVTLASQASWASNVVTLRIFPEPFVSGEMALITGCTNTAFNESPVPVVITGVTGGSITYANTTASGSTTGCAASGGTQNNYLAKVTPTGMKFPVPTDTSVPVYVVSSGGGVTGNALYATAGNASCTMSATASNTAGEYVVMASGAQCSATSSPGSAFVVGTMVSNSTTAGSPATINVSGGYPASGGGSSTTVQVNGTALSTQSPVNFQSGALVTVSNPSAGTVQISAAPQAFWTPGLYPNSTLGFGLNTEAVSGITLTYPVTASSITLSVNSTDSTSGDLYSFGIFNSSGTLVAHIAPTALTTIGNFTASFLEGTVSFAAGQYYVGTTANASTARVLAGTNAVTFLTDTNGAATTGGAQPSSITPP